MEEVTKNKSGNSLQTHWEKAYSGAEIKKLGWFEGFPVSSLRLIRKCKLDKSARMLHVGTGASTLIDRLVEEAYENIIANDISEKALSALKDRLGKNQNTIEWIVDDLTHPKHLNRLEPIDLWHDRAVLHFFTEDSDRENYFKLLKKLVKTGGFVILATFNKTGATRCSGLPVKRYDEIELQNELGEGFEMIEHFNYIYINPSDGKRPYVYTLFKRKNT